jgi:hypothetical protein
LIWSKGKRFEETGKISYDEKSDPTAPTPAFRLGARNNDHHIRGA